MSKQSDQKRAQGERPRIALITNHGYAGVEIPVGGAPDTGGQNFYVNSLAAALDELGHDVTIFARGGFPFFDSSRIRQGTEQLGEHSRYVYVPGGGDEFIHKEDIAPALDEETAWLERYVEERAAEAGLDPWRYFTCVNTHYWDAAVMGVKLVERWRDRRAFEFLRGAAGGVLARSLERFAGDEMHRLGLSREIHLHLGSLALEASGGDDPKKALELLGVDLEREAAEGLESPPGDVAPTHRDLLRAWRLGRLLFERLEIDGEGLADLFAEANRHVWTPHSIGVIKERNYWNKDPQVVRSLKFRERDSHEQMVCSRTPLFCSTSPEIWRALVSWHGVEQERIFDFPPCIDGRIFRPRDDDELGEAYAYLAEESGLPEEKLRQGKIVFETSRMDHTKRKDLLLEAFADVAEEIDDVYLFIGGGPDHSPVFGELAELRKKLPALQGRGFLLGFVPEEALEPLFSLADVFATASEMEGFGMSASQAAAAGTALVCSDLIPFATQYAADAALVFPAGDRERLASALKRLLRDDDERARRGRRLQDIAAELDWRATAERFLEWFGQNRPEAEPT